MCVCVFRSRCDEAAAVWHGSAAVVHWRSDRHGRRSAVVRAVCLQSVAVPASTPKSQISSFQWRRLQYALLVF